MNLVLEYLESDLEHVIKDKSITLSTAHIKSWMQMMLLGLEHCHRCWILHRDMKPNNLLLASDGQLKISDFGMARAFGEPMGNMTSQVVTRCDPSSFFIFYFNCFFVCRWYRAPELLYGAKDYGSAVDMWSVGCIFAELMLRTPFMAGETDMDQLKTIFRALGTPTEAEWPVCLLPKIFN